MKRNISEPFGEPATSWRKRITLKSLRFRLALWAAAILCGIQLLLGIAFYLLTSNWLQDQLDNTLSATASQVVAALEGADVIDDNSIKFQLSDEDVVSNVFLRERLFFIRIIDQQRSEVIETSARYDIAITDEARANRPGYETLPLPDSDTPMRVYTLPLEDSALALQVGVSLAEVNATQAQIVRLMVAALVVTIILGGGSGLFLANRALIPVQAVTRTARQISERDLAQRITLNLSDDELGQLARTFNAMLDRIEQGFQQQQRFTADAAHELRTPLSIIQTGIDVTLSQERSPGQYRAALETIREETQRLTTLTANLLTLARADAHLLTLNRHPIDLSMLVNTVLDQLVPVAAQKNVTVQRDIVPQLPLYADEDRLIQLALNLIENGVKYTPEGGSITVSVSRAAGKARLIVADTGPGIPPGQLSRIFDRFYRLDRSRNREQGGFGLGLAIAQQIAHLHDGEIDVASQVGVGTQFTVTLPTS